MPSNNVLRVRISKRPWQDIPKNTGVSRYFTARIWQSPKSDKPVQTTSCRHVDCLSQLVEPRQISV